MPLFLFNMVVGVGFEGAVGWLSEAPVEDKAELCDVAVVAVDDGDDALLVAIIPCQLEYSVNYSVNTKRTD